MKWHKISEELPPANELVLLFVELPVPSYHVGYKFMKRFFVDNSASIHTHNFSNIGHQ